MTLAPRERLVIESRLAPAAVLAAIPQAVTETNRRTVLLAIRSEVDDDRVRVGYWLPVAFVHAGIAFEGSVGPLDGGAVIAGDVRLFPQWYEILFTILLVFAAAGALMMGLSDGQPWMGVLGAVWLSGGARLAMEIMFRAYRRKISHALNAAAGS